MTHAFDALSRRVLVRLLPRLIGLARDFGRAEDALQDALEAGWKAWGQGSWPHNPEAWLWTVARRRLLDGLRQRGLVGSEAWDAARDESMEGQPMVSMEEGLGGEDDSLRLIFTCCHPALAPEAQVALTLNSLCGLTAAEIGAAFLVSKLSMAQRLVRVKSKIRAAGIPFRVPPEVLLGERLPGVLRVFYLVFTTGHSAPSGTALMRVELCAEALRLTRMLLEYMPGEPELKGLLALMLLQHGRAAARADAKGNPILLEHQDRSLWDRAQLEEGEALLVQALGSGQPGSYQLQAAIAALHAQAASYADTDWMQILLLYDRLLGEQPSPVVELNRAVALAMARGPAAGLQAVERLASAGDLQGYLYLHSTRAELLQRLGRIPEARTAYGRALELAENAAQQAFLRGRLEVLPN